MKLCFTTLHFRRATLLLALASVTTASLATPVNDLRQELELRGYRVIGETTEIHNYRLNAWSAIDDKHLMIRSGPKEQYLVTFRSSCHDLRTNETITFSSTGTRLTKFDKATVMGAGNIPQHCFIESIYQLEKIPKP